MPRTQFDFDQADDAEFASQWELEQVMDNNAIPAEFVPLTMNNWELWKRIGNISGRANDGNMIFFDPSGKTYIEYGGSTYTDEAFFIFRGTDIWTPASFKAVASRSGTVGTSYVRMYDVTHAQQIAEISYTDAGAVIRESNSITNLPTGQSLFVLQMRSTGSKTRIHAASLYPTT